MHLPDIRFKNYKSFGDEWSILDSLSNINVLIGRNNAGKSSVLDIIESLTDANVFYNNSSRGASYAVKLGHTITEENIMQVFHINSIYLYDRTAILEQACGMYIEFLVNIEPIGTSRNRYKYKYERKKCNCHLKSNVQITGIDSTHM